MIAYWFPKPAMVLAGVGLVLAVPSVTHRACTAVAPSIVGHQAYTVVAPMPQEIQDMGAPARLTMHTHFEEADLWADVEELPMDTVQTLLRQLAIQATENSGSLPIRVVDAHFVLSADGHRITLEHGSWGDVDAVIDASCAPNCPGCGIIAC